MTQPILYESHSHTPLCHHATGAPVDYAHIAEQRGLKGLIVTCHNPMPDGFSSRVRMRIDQFEEYVELVYQASTQYEGRVDVRLGLEADYFEGYESFLERQLASADFHYVLGSVHPQIYEYKQRYTFADPVEVQKNYFDLLAQAAETKLFDSLAHPDLIKNETADDWIPERILDHICRVLDRIAATGIAMELNTSGKNKVVPEMNPCPQILEKILERDIPIVLGADAHVPSRVADSYLDALDILETCGFTHISIFLNRHRQEISLTDARQSLVLHSH